MKHLISLTLFCCSLTSLQAQLTPEFVTNTFRIYIEDSDHNPPFLYQYSTGEYWVYFSDPNINAIFDNYVVTMFKESFPAARRPYMRRYWDIETSNIYLINDLLNYDSTYFKDVQILIPETFSYTPNDYGLATGQQDDLELINAKDAWEYTKGDPNVVVGINDTWFDFTNPDLPPSKFVQIRDTAQSGIVNHGTAVAGCVAGETDNNIGLAAIGFNTRLDVSTSVNTRSANLLQMSKDGRRIVNGSWYVGYVHYLSGQQLYDDIYENGTIAFFGAGNGKAHNNYNAIYPAAYNHNFAVTSVGYDQSPTATKNRADIHEIEVGNHDSMHSHYPEVDLSAPGYYVNVALSGSKNGGTYFGQRDGTSFASPMTAGTAALMLAVNPCLSPYQIEWILKKTSDDIYSKPENAAYIGKLGAGRLNARDAVARASIYNCNERETQTMDIKGVELNTICAPGYASNSVLPQLIPVIVNGTPPYTYEWRALARNKSSLDDSTIAQPTVMASASPHVAHYYLIVKDASEIQKVASREILINFDTSGYDLAMRDSYLDMLDEPNSQAYVDPHAWNIWDSPDIWNRHAQDDGLAQQNPAYHPTDSNYLYVRVRNVGCETAPATAKIRLYWTLASTGEKWPEDWTTANYPSDPGLPAGRQITDISQPLDVPVLEPGQSVLLSKSWKPQNPKDYDNLIDDLAICVLARIEESPLYPFGMSINEVGGKITTNVVNNNNIVTRNLVLTELNAMAQAEYLYLSLVANPDNTAQYFTLQFVNDKILHPHYAGEGNGLIFGTLTLDPILYSRWASGGFQGSYFLKDDYNSSVVFLGGDKMELQNILLYAGERFEVKTHLQGGDFSSFPETYFRLNFRQLNAAGELYGNITYQIESTPTNPAIPISMAFSANGSDGLYYIYPNPTSDDVALEYHGEDRVVDVKILDVSGRALRTESRKKVGYSPTHINLKGLPSGIYLLNLTDENGKSNNFKIIKK